MEISLILNNDLRIDEEILKGINEYNEVFNMDQNELIELNMAFAAEKNLTLNNDPEFKEVYEIYVESVRVGIMLLIQENDPEIGIVRKMLS
ncbi:hypothetical protein bcere0026_22340 [Bacillus mycoides]|uniref:Uncharacterized protein n=1 Tax=Bacillus mycoides TaxID=1405 RepID=C2XU63_BACMY|nr:hypothetical protein bcere0026_22340 [Bacillus mycoides]